jgi:hypothetical protein
MLTRGLSAIATSEQAASIVMGNNFLMGFFSLYIVIH